MRIKKKNTRGNAKNYITRTQAVKKLQVSLADFRRLCIFKGIYPREPRNKKKANKGSTAPTTFYYSKDIQYLIHEPVLAKFREHKSFAKKLTRALGRGEVGSAKRLEENRSSYKLDHIIKERYPSFPDALRDIDDALNMLFLFANLPATNQISAKITHDAQKLCNQWLAFVARERLVRKVFVSIKGVYYQASVRGEDIRWLVPFKFPENIPSDVDFRIMLTFLEFYSTLLHFVLYKLYTDNELVYPPKLDVEKDKIITGLSSYILESQNEESVLSKPKLSQPKDDEVTVLDEKALSSALKADVSKEQQDANGETEAASDEENVKDVELDAFEDNSKIKVMFWSNQVNSTPPVSTLFSDFVFYVGREVPLDIVEFLILSAGGNVVSEVAVDELESKDGIDLSKITHQIVDRPVLKNKVPGRTYIQPQWIFDCINKADLVPANLYVPGEPLPPHLSPWGDSIGYNPEANAEKEENSEEEEEESVSEEEEQNEVAEDQDQELVVGEDDDEEAAELAAQKELELEAQGVPFSEVKNQVSKQKPKGKKRKVTEEEEEKNLKLIMMSNKQRKLYKKMQYSNSKKDEQVEKLKSKKKQIDKAKKKLNKLNEKS
ncbi:mRNA-binding ribosome synthesis protein NOP7 KNAG_0B01010 [Huiozyma naganishii CBS 8797]|uniref:Pescadillo homolog n=1 Tax=Huiozyma naganishii (strain ATCC MYA-139 / BCRC 22969 / CBS 8797 / KCTC 17520 / NBRC 10181 / NCYC 3082 / Yp74L-3) TaxID=1071383 RepID=J7RG86_HUIN7|nr:hypothetical protein KNAG_0B01010 [Kazachstania naganishii CBS 8797]CCK68548.1 hypothetical protein KNAG_0B01010 [Kazachstania naganishii CBS 8797]